MRTHERTGASKNQGPRQRRRGPVLFFTLADWVAMLVEELIQQLCDKPDDLLEDLKVKFSVLCSKQKDLEVRMTNLKKVIRVVTDVKARLDRNEEEIGALHEALSYASTHSDDGEIDLYNLYALTMDS